MMSPHTTTTPYHDHDSDATMEAESSALAHPPPTPYRISFHDERPMRAHRAQSWGSDDTLGDEGSDVRPQIPANMKAYQSGHPDLDLEFLGVDASRRHRTRRRPWMIFIVACCAVLVVILVVLDMVLRMSESTWPVVIDDGEDDIFRNWGQGGTGTEALSWYPTNFLQDVIPKPIHSHNDYWRKVPLFTAIHQGCTGVEADVWLLDDEDGDDGAHSNSTLYVGHERAALQGNRTFQSLYVQPLVEILERANPTTSFYNGTTATTARGVFDTAPGQTLTLLVDVKTAGAATWRQVVEQLEPLRRRGWLSYYADGVVHTRPITVVGTGNTPFAEVVNGGGGDADTNTDTNTNTNTTTTTYRDYFFDAPLAQLDNASAPYNADNSYYASVAFSRSIGAVWMGQLSPDQVARVRAQVAQAHARGLKARYWDLPAWPVQTRNMVWDVLVREGVDMLNVDDVKSAAKKPWRY